MDLSKSILTSAVGLTVFLLAAKSPAPIPILGDFVRPKPHTEAQRAEELRMSGVQPEVGVVRMNEQDIHDRASNNESNARSVLAAAQHRRDEEEAVKVLEKANSAIAAESATPSANLPLAFLIISVGVGGFFGLKRWADKALPGNTVEAKNLRW